MQKENKKPPSLPRLNKIVLLAGASLSLAFAGLVFIVSSDFSQDIQYPKMQFWTSYAKHLHMNFFLAPFIAALIYLLAVRDKYYRNAFSVLKLPLILLLGEASYSLYLMHPIMLRVVPLADGYPNIAFRLAMSMILACAIAVGTYKLIEVPGKQVLKRILQRH
ncbi:hypothetical protein N9W44_01575 [Alphaproteobacteria bacterium]|nr:hypothetical protein [Alphaproteobacteria bacterium]